VSAAAAAELVWNYITPAHLGWSTGLMNILPGCQVSRRLGHASPTITMSIYAHVLPGSQREAANLFASLIAEAKPS